MNCMEVEPGLYCVTLEIQIPRELSDEFLSKLPYLSESLVDFHLDADRNELRFRCSGDAAEAGVIAERIVESAHKLVENFRGRTVRTLVSRDRPVTFKEDPHPLLEASGDLVRFGAGRVGLGPLLVRLCDFFDGQLRKLAEDFAARAYQFPALIGAEVLERCKYLKSFPHSLSLVSHLKEDLRAIQEFARTVHWERDSLAYEGDALSKVQCLLSPTICFHCYAWLQGASLPHPQSFTAVGRCFRYESGNLGGLERLWDFTMREIIFVGPEDYVLAQRAKAIDKTVELLDEWQLSFDISTATDPFFIDEYSMASFQAAFELKYEIQARLPYREKSTAVGSFNFHRDLFGRSLNITDTAGQPLTTGCVGFGLERLALAFLAQHGLDKRRWPRSVAE